MSRLFILFVTELGSALDMNQYTRHLDDFSYDFNELIMMMITFNVVQ